MGVEDRGQRKSGRTEEILGKKYMKTIEREQDEMRLYIEN